MQVPKSDSSHPCPRQTFGTSGESNPGQKKATRGQKPPVQIGPRQKPALCHRQVRDREVPGRRPTAGPGARTAGNRAEIPATARAGDEQGQKGPPPTRPWAAPSGVGERPPAAHHRTDGSFCSSTETATGPSATPAPRRLGNTRLGGETPLQVPQLESRSRRGAPRRALPTSFRPGEALV